MSAAVTSGGRIFLIVDESPLASIRFLSDWKLVARDAFNGTVLWKKAIPEWSTHLWPLKSGPTQLARRLVAIGERPVSPADYEDQRARRLVEREFNLSWAQDLRPDNTIVSGTWWKPGARWNRPSTTTRRPATSRRTSPTGRRCPMPPGRRSSGT